MKKEKQEKSRNRKQTKRQKQQVNEMQIKSKEILPNDTKVENKQEKTSKTLKKKMVLYIVLALILCYIIYTLYLLIKQPTDTFTVEEGKLYQEETDIGYVIRDEQVVRGTNYKNGMEQIKLEGEKAGKNEAIFRYYSNNEENLKKNIQELDTKIQEVMGQDKGYVNSDTDIKLLENQIDEKMQYINQIKDVNKLEEYKKEIDDLVSKKAKIAGENSPQGSYLKQLIEQRKTYESQLNSGAEYVNAPKSGIVSYKVDGLEETLTPDCFSELSKEYLENLNLQTGKVVATSEECGKIIDNFVCYIATISNSENAKQARVGDKIKVRLSNNEEVSAEIVNIANDSEEDALLMLKIEKGIQELINYRKISFDLIWWDEQGLKVPNQAIVKENDLNYVVRKRAGYLNKILVKVTKEGENYSIVESYESEELKELGFTNEEIANYKKISLYDEIVLNPDLSKVE